MLKLITRLLLGSAARAGGQVLDAEARLAVPPRALTASDGLTGPEKVIPARSSGRTMADCCPSTAQQRSATPTLH